MNGDAYSDVVVGAPSFDNGETNEGRAFVYLGSAAGLAASPAWTAESNQGSANLGISVASAGDVTGDGYSDVVVGAHLFDSGQPDEGRAFLYLGNEGSGALARPRQRLADDSAPIALLGQTITGSYRASLNVRSPFGRGDARLAVESKPLGMPFDGTSLTQSSLVDTGTSGADTSVTIGGLPTNTQHHWRARVVHSKATTPFLPAGPWFSIQGNGATEQDLRTAVCGGSLAAAVSYGTGKPGTNGIPTLTSAAPALGSTPILSIGNGLAGAAPVYLLSGFAPASIPFQGGTIHVLIASLLVLPPLGPSGTLAIPLPLPTSTAFCGQSLYLQVGFVDPGASGYYHLALTNGLSWTVGS